MKTRCYNPRNKRYDRYGGRGIIVCERWLNSFENFLADMGRRPSPVHSLDRKDNDGNYEPGNCRWATAREQANNSSHVRWLAHGGVTLSLTGWAHHLGIGRTALEQRLRKGVPLAIALTVRSMKYGPRIRY